MLPAGFTEPCNSTVSERPPSGPYWFMKSSTRLPDDLYTGLEVRMKRRNFITLMGGVAAWPLVGYAQEPKVRRVGALLS